MRMTTTQTDFAYYFQNHHRPQEENYLKNLLLFFDGISMMRPTNKLDPLMRDRAVTGAMIDAGLLVILEPDQVLHSESATGVSRTLASWLSRKSPTIATSLHEPRSRFWIGPSRYNTATLLNGMFGEIYRNFFPQGNSVSAITDNPEASAKIWALLLTLIQDPGNVSGLDLTPVVEESSPATWFFEDLLNELRPTTIGDVVALDLAEIGIDLTSVPLDEVLDFRQSHGQDYIEYRHAVNVLVGQLSAAEPAQKQELLAHRQSELQEQARTLHRNIRSAFTTRNLGSFALGAAGAAWGLKSGNLPAAGVGLAQALWSLTADASKPGSLIYLFDARREWQTR